MTTTDNAQEEPLLPLWATLTEVSRAFGISRNALKAAARRAIKDNAKWATKENEKIFLNTQHPEFKERLKQWMLQKDQSATLSEEEDAVTGDLFPPEDLFASHYRFYPSLALEGHDHWPALCQWLSSQGLSVSFNLLISDPSPALQWHWGGLQGQGYATIKDAIIAALDAKLHAPPTPDAHLTSDVKLLSYQTARSSERDIPNYRKNAMWGSGYSTPVHTKRRNWFFPF